MVSSTHKGYALCSLVPFFRKNRGRVTKKSPFRVLLGALAATMVGLLGAFPAPASATTTGGNSASGTATGSPQGPFGGTTQSVCPAAPAGYASCLATIIDHSGEQSHI